MLRTAYLQPCCDAFAHALLCHVDRSHAHRFLRARAVAPGTVCCMTHQYHDVDHARCCHVALTVMSPPRERTAVRKIDHARAWRGPLSVHASQWLPLVLAWRMQRSTLGRTCMCSCLSRRGQMSHRNLRSSCFVIARRLRHVTIMRVSATAGQSTPRRVAAIHSCHNAQL